MQVNKPTIAYKLVRLCSKKPKGGVIVRGESRKEYLWKQPYYAAIQNHAFPTLLGKDDSKIFYSWFLIFAFITRIFAFFMFTLVLFFNEIYLSLHFDEYPWET